MPAGIKDLRNFPRNNQHQKKINFALTEHLLIGISHCWISLPARLEREIAILEMRPQQAWTPAGCCSSMATCKLLLKYPTLDWILSHWAGGMAPAPKFPLPSYRQEVWSINGRISVQHRVENNLHLFHGKYQVQNLIERSYFSERQDPKLV